MSRCSKPHSRSPRFLALFSLGLVLLLSWFSAAAHASTGTEARDVVGGHADRYEPGVVAIVGPQGGLICSGVIIGETLILTAAHCLDKPLDRVLVTPDIALGDNEWLIVQTRAHSAYLGGARGSDIALLLVDRPLPVSPLSLPKTMSLTTSDDVEVVGYGRRDGIGSNGQQSRRSTEATKISTVRFRHGESSCLGDSGGGVFDESTGIPVLVGIVSSGAADCKGESSAVRVAAHLQWLRDNIHSATELFCLGEATECNQVVGACSTAPQESPLATIWLFLLTGLVLIRNKARGIRLALSGDPHASLN